MFSHLLPVGAGWARRSLFGREEKVLFLFVVIGMVTEFVTYFMVLRKINTLWVLHVHHLLEFVMLMLILGNWQDQRAIHRLALLSIPVYTVFWIVSLFTIESFCGPATYTHNVAGALLVILAAITLYNLMNESEIEVYRELRFWAAAGVLIYFAGNTVLFLLFDRRALLRSQDALTVWKLHWVIDTFVNLSYTASFLCLRRP